MSGWRLEHTYADLPALFHARVAPTPVRKPRLVAFNGPLADAMGLDTTALVTDEGAAIFAGNTLPEGAQPLAQAYAGHQFGHFTTLGDGRAILLGEQITPDGRRVDIQLKGAGQTPYSRRGDGRAALGPMLREFIISEAMHALGIPTTRSLAVVATGEPVYREQPAARRRAHARGGQPHPRRHLRVGRGPPRHRGAHGASPTTRGGATIRSSPRPRARTSRSSTRSSSARRRSIARWQLVGFVHGVMNTDNMALSGETIDYGPCAFMDAYDPATVFSSIDSPGALRLRQPARHRAVEPRAPGRGDAAALRRATGGGHRAGHRRARPLRESVPPPLAGRHARQARALRGRGRRRFARGRAADVDASTPAPTSPTPSARSCAPAEAERLAQGDADVRRVARTLAGATAAPAAVGGSRRAR